MNGVAIQSVLSYSNKKSSQIGSKTVYCILVSFVLL